MEISTEETNDGGAVPSLETIEFALKLVESKKEALKEAFLHLESHPSSSFLPFSWPEIDAHFSAVSNSLHRRFSSLNRSRVALPSPSKIPENPKHSPSSSELCLLCKEMDGKGVRTHISSRPEHSKVTRSELANALRFAHDSSLLVLDAVENCEKLINKEKLVCSFILEEFVNSKPDSIPKEIKIRAKSIGLKWIKCLNSKQLFSPLLSSLVHLIAGFALGKELDQRILVTCFSSAFISDSISTPSLIKSAELDSSTICSIINKILKKRKYYCALRCVCELNLKEKYSPEDIVRAYINNITNRRTTGANSVSLKTKRSADIHGIQRVIKLIEDYPIGYSKTELEEQIEMLKRQMGDGILTLPAGKGSKKRKKMTENKQRKKMTENKQRKKMTLVANGAGGRCFSARPVVRLPVQPPFLAPCMQFPGNAYGAMGGNYRPIHGLHPPFLDYNNLNIHN